MPPEVRARIIDLYQEGQMSVVEISHETGFSVGGIHTMLRREGIPRGRRAGAKLKPWSEPDLIRLEGLRRAGWKKEDLVVEFSCGYDRLNRGLYRLGLRNRIRPRGGRVRNVGGYTLVIPDPDDPVGGMRHGNGYVMEHRLVMARSLGRPLEAHETVHHINGDKSDNRVENLQLRVGKHGNGVTMTCIDCGSHNIKAVPLAGHSRKANEP